MKANRRPCASWEEFQTAVPDNAKVSQGLRIYRGQRDPEWLLQSIFERFLGWISAKDKNPNNDVRDLYGSDLFDKMLDRYLSDFKKNASKLPGLPDQLDTDRRWWAVGRHYGLVTPLLDWTRSPRIAAFFAFIDHLETENPDVRNGLRRLGIGGQPPGIKPSGPGAVSVWELVLNEAMLREGEFEHFEEDLSSLTAAGRIGAQQGTFTRLSHRHVDLLSYLAERQLESFLTCYEIPLSETRKALADLSCQGINFGKLFPDLQGAAIQANIGTFLEDLQPRKGGANGPTR
jgi:FRG domain-containing protein